MRITRTCVVVVLSVYCFVLAFAHDDEACLLSKQTLLTDCDSKERNELVSSLFKKCLHANSSVLLSDDLNEMLSKSMDNFNHFEHDDEEQHGKKEPASGDRHVSLAKSDYDLSHWFNLTCLGQKLDMFKNTGGYFAELNLVRFRRLIDLIAAESAACKIMDHDHSEESSDKMKSKPTLYHIHFRFN
jgi:hypothetical protein